MVEKWFVDTQHSILDLYMVSANSWHSDQTMHRHFRGADDVMQVANSKSLCLIIRGFHPSILPAIGGSVLKCCIMLKKVNDIDNKVTDAWS